MYRSLLTKAREIVDLKQTRLDRAIARAAPLARGELLDVGCGDKPHEALFLPHVTRYVGVEWDETYGTSAYRQASRRADVVYQGDVLPFDDASFDTVLCNQVLEHVPEPRGFFGQLARVLKPGGRLILTVPFAYRVHSRPSDFHRFTRYALALYAAENNLVVERLEGTGGFWSVVGQKVTCHLAVHVGRLGRDVQRVGGFGYEPPIATRPRYWALPLLAPAIAAVAIATNALDDLVDDDSETLDHLLVAKKRGVGIEG